MEYLWTFSAIVSALLIYTLLVVRLARKKYRHNNRYGVCKNKIVKISVCG